jgi:Fic family protein
VHQLTRQKPIIAIPDAARETGMSAPPVAKSIQHLRDLGLLREITGKQRGRMFVYSDYLGILSQGTEPI